MARFFRKKLLVSALGGLLWLSGCAASTDGPWRDAAPDAPDRLWTARPEAQRIALASLLDVDFSVEGKCDSCHGASANYWEFEYDNILDSMAREFWPEATVLRFAPGIPPFAEGDSAIDGFVRGLAAWSGSGDGICQGVDSSLVALRYAVPPEIRKLTAKLSAKYNVDLLLLPGKTEVTLFPRGNEPKGSVRIVHRFSVWDLRRGEPLYRSCRDLVWKSPRGEQIDRMTTPLVLDPVGADLKTLRDGWVPPEPR
ncbi:MAG: hypothetical protein J6Z50_00925 [Fibrobacterales bacterium]|nr:hypothetical protein [Fibrobacterales bacterium]MBP5187670.1 hypothetical protein [Fibrobacterales bacterium]